MADGDVDAKITTTRAFPCNVFDGVDDYVEVPHDASQLGANLSNGFTISAWINPRSLGESSGVILDKSTAISAENGFYFKLNDSAGVVNRARFRINVGTDANTAVSGVLSSRWQHVIVTVSSGQLANFYINGVLSGTADQDLVQTISTITTTNAPRIGNRSTATDRTFDGGIRSVKMWNRVLSTTEITEEYAGTNHTEGLIHNFKLGGDYTDYGSVGVTATNSGSLPQIVDDAVATVIKDQRTTATLSGTHFITKLGNSQICSIAITETI